MRWAGCGRFMFLPHACRRDLLLCGHREDSAAGLGEHGHGAQRISAVDFVVRGVRILGAGENADSLSNPLGGDEDNTARILANCVIPRRHCGRTKGGLRQTWSRRGKRLIFNSQSSDFSAERKRIACGSSKLVGPQARISSSNSRGSEGPIKPFYSVDARFVTFCLQTKHGHGQAMDLESTCLCESQFDSPPPFWRP